MSMYREPPWAQKPTQEWSLLEIKSGVECATYPLHTRACTVLGRAADMVNITLAHESCSRQHARIAFDSGGIPWLRDLQSTHGTTCNKRKLPNAAIGKVESNSTKAGARGVILYPGDVLQFGASSRLFCVQGPAEFERGAMQAKMKQQQAAAGERLLQQTESSDRQEEKETGVSWGLSMDEDVGDDQVSVATDKKLPLDLQVPEKHRKAFERLNALKYKLANIETEDGRIRRKGDLSEGQERQLQRNQEREEALKKSIVQLEEEIYDKLYPEKAGTSHKKRSRHEDVDGDDDFFDRTKQSEEEVIEDGESEKTLIEKWKKYNQQEEHRLKVSLPKAEEHVSMLAQRLNRMESNGDDEAFFAKNDLDLAKESLDKIRKQQQKTQTAMDEIERLLMVVNPKINVDRSSGYIGEGPPPIDNSKTSCPPEHPEMPPPPVSLPAFERTMPPPKIERAMPPPSMGRTMPPPALERCMPPPPAKQKKPSCDENILPESAERSHSILPPPAMPPPKRKRVVGPSMPPPGAVSSQPSAQKKSADNISSQGTLASIASMFQEDPKRPSQSTQSAKTESAKKNSIGLQEDVWQAPKDQDGSGMTKLNSKFAGRY